MPEYHFEMLCEDRITRNTMVHIFKQKYDGSVQYHNRDDPFCFHFSLNTHCKDIDEADKLSRKILDLYRGAICRVQITPMVLFKEKSHHYFDRRWLKKLFSPFMIGDELR